MPGKEFHIPSEPEEMKLPPQPGFFGALLKIAELYVERDVLDVSHTFRTETGTMEVYHNGKRSPGSHEHAYFEFKDMTNQSLPDLTLGETFYPVKRLDLYRQRHDSWVSIMHGDESINGSRRITSWTAPTRVIDGGHISSSYVLKEDTDPGVPRVSEADMIDWLGYMGQLHADRELASDKSGRTVIEKHKDDTDAQHIRDITRELFSKHRHGDFTKRFPYSEPGHIALQTGDGKEVFIDMVSDPYSQRAGEVIVEVAGDNDGTTFNNTLFVLSSNNADNRIRTCETEDHIDPTDPQEQYVHDLIKNLVYSGTPLEHMLPQDAGRLAPAKEEEKKRLITILNSLNRQESGGQ